MTHKLKLGWKASAGLVLFGWGQWWPWGARAFLAGLPSMVFYVVFLWEEFRG